MSKKERIWFAVFLAMFLIPEAIWGGMRLLIFNAFIPSGAYGLNSNDFPSIENNLIGFIVTQSQLIGLLGIFLLFLKVKNKLFIKIPILLFLSVMIFFAIILAWMGLYVMFNTPQIG